MRDRCERSFSLSYDLQQPFDTVLGEVGIEVAESVKVGDGRNDEVVLDSRGKVCGLPLSTGAVVFRVVVGVTRDEGTF